MNERSLGHPLANASTPEKENVQKSKETGEKIWEKQKN